MINLYTNNLVLNEGYSMPNLLIEKAYGCYLEDTNCNKYIDTSLGNGTHILGHSPRFISESISNQLKKGVLYCAPNNHTYEVAELIQQCIPSTIDSVVFCNTGSEATMRAARIARAYNNKNKIAIFSGSWHGGNEIFNFDHDYHSTNYATEHKSLGIPDDFKKNVIVLPYNNEEAFDLIEKHSNDIAMVIIEPSQGSNPRDDMLKFLIKLRKVTQKNKIVLCFDEMITGFRLAIGGCIEYYGVVPDIVTYGKTIGGGLPIGLVAGSSKVMNVLKTNKNTLPVFMGGTFSANPLAMSTTKTLLLYLIKNKDKIYTDLNDKGNYLKNSINNYCIKNNIALRMIGIGSMVRLVFSDYSVMSRRERDQEECDISIQRAFYKDLLIKKNIFVNSNGIIFLSTEHSHEDVDSIMSGIIDLTSLLKS
jgi:glutamate-1-semialdehyde 2,1-aminomutase